MNAPIIVFAYNCPDHLSQTLDALSKNRQAESSDVFVFIDGPKKESGMPLQKEVVSTAKSFESRFKSMTLNVSEKNKGLANSIIGGASAIIEKYGRAIILEDDAVTSKSFIEFMNGALDFYENDPTVWSVGAYIVPIELPEDYKHSVIKTQRVSSSAWATWKSRLKKTDWDVSDYKKFLRSPKIRRGFNRWGEDRSSMLDDQMNGRIDSWAIRFDYSMYKNGMYNIVPLKSLITNIGHDGSGTHTASVSYGENPFKASYEELPESLSFSHIDTDERIRREFIKPYRYSSVNRFRRYFSNALMRRKSRSR